MKHRSLQLVREARAALAHGDVAEAESLCRLALQHDVEDEAALDVLTAVLVRTGRAAEAVSWSRAVLRHFRRLSAQNSVVYGLHLLHSLGFRPQGILDIGAYDGEFTLLARQFFPDAAVMMVEPQEAKQPQLRQVAAELGAGVRVRRTVLGDRQRPECVFTELDTPYGSTGSSLYPELSDYPRRQVSMSMTTVDALVAEWPERRFDLVKIDVQGGELDVIRGAERTLRDVEALFVELSMHRCNHGAPLLAEVVAALDSRGFAAFDLLGMPRTDEGIQRQIDALFVRKGSALWREPALAEAATV